MKVRYKNFVVENILKSHLNVVNVKKKLLKVVLEQNIVKTNSFKHAATDQTMVHP